MAMDIGKVGWADLTVKDAETVRDFYAQVIGWAVEEVAMGGYSDYCMIPPGGKEPAAGVCHARGINAKLPPQWMIYVPVANLTVSVEACKKLGGKVLDGPRDMGGQMFCAIQDPAGAVMGLVGPV
jgi:uncharacterized protein